MAKEPPLAPSDGENHVRIRRGRVESVDLYEIKDSELEILERGSPADLQLNFAIFLLSLSFTGVCTLATATFEKPRIEQAFLIVTVAGALLGAYLLISWFRNRTSLRVLCKRIRQRIPPDSIVVVAGVEIEETTVASNKPQG